MRKLMIVVAAAGLILGAGADRVVFDFSQAKGPVKPSHGIGQGPLQGNNDFSMFRYLREAGVPYARLHDVGGTFGKNLYVDIPNLFRDFDADENDPASYDFTFTDQYLKALVDNGVEPYFRLGVTIEVFSRTVKPYRIFPPRDFAKWARICEHVVRHYTEGWADGFRHKIAYWEIWNEPDDFPDHRNAMWRGTWRQYCELYEITARHLKSKFPQLKVGGYGRCSAHSITAHLHGRPTPVDEVYRDKCFEEFMAFIQERKCPLDFFSFHGYISPEMVGPHADFHRAALDRAGYPAAELHLNEWLCGGPRRGDFWNDAAKASPIAAFIVALQESKVDIGMVYDGRCQLSSYSPLFDPIRLKPGKAYYAIKYFNALYRLGTEVPVAVPGGQGASGLWAVAAKGPVGAAAFIVNDSNAARPLDCDFGGRTVAACRIVDATRTDVECALPALLGPHAFVLVNLK